MQLIFLNLFEKKQKKGAREQPNKDKKNHPLLLTL